MFKHLHSYHSGVNKIRRALKAAWPVRASVVIATIVAVVLFTDQAIDALVVLAEDDKAWVQRWLLLPLAAVSLALMLWYCPRLLQNALATADMAAPGIIGLVARHLPRVCGVLPVGLLGVAMIVAAGPSRQAASADSGRLAGMAALMFVLAVILYLGFCVRGRLLKPQREQLAQQWEQEKQRATERHTPRLLVRDLPRGTKIGAAAVGVATLGLFMVFTVFPQQVGPWAGPVAIMVISAAIWVALGSLLAYASAIARVPLLLVLVLMAVLFGSLEINDNHEVRHVVNTASPPARPAFDETFSNWLENRPDRGWYQNRNLPYPVVVVAAEGGGIYAAYHSATVLAMLQDRNPWFACHVFAISGVSGGSLGGTTFAALAKRAELKVPLPTPTDIAWQGQPTLWAVEHMLSSDFLSPLLATMLYPDLVQRLLPFPIGPFDRSRSLEEAFERGWESGTGGGTEFAQPFDNLWKDFPTGGTPSLLLNVTDVETGRRLVITNLSLDNPNQFYDLVAIRERHPTASLFLSSATALSARFPYVTPAGYLHGQAAPGNPSAARPKHRYVDGGYFENSGMATAGRVVSAILSPTSDNEVKTSLKVLQRSVGRPEFRLVVLRIGLETSPNGSRATATAATAPAASPPVERLQYEEQGLSELLSPVRTLLNTRQARGTSAVEQLRATLFLANLAEQADGGNGQTDHLLFEFLLRQDRVPLPLGWLLSDRARANIREQVATSAVDGRTNIGQILSLLPPSEQPPAQASPTTKPSLPVRPTTMPANAILRPELFHKATRSEKLK